MPAPEPGEFDLDGYIARVGDDPLMTGTEIGRHMGSDLDPGQRRWALRQLARDRMALACGRRCLDDEQAGTWAAIRSMGDTLAAAMADQHGTRAALELIMSDYRTEPAGMRNAA